ADIGSMCGEYEGDARNRAACTGEYPVGVDYLAAGGHFLRHDLAKGRPGQQAVGEDAKRVVGAEAVAEESGGDTPRGEIGRDIAGADHDEPDLDAAITQGARERPDE